MNNIWGRMLIVAAWCGLGLLARAQAPADAVVARVNGEAVLLSQLKEAALDSQIPLASLTSEGLQGDGYRQALTMIIDETLLVQKAQEESIQGDDAAIARDVDKMIGRLRERQGSEEKMNAYLKARQLDLASLRRALTERERKSFLTMQVISRRVQVDPKTLEEFAADRRRLGEPLEEVRLAQILIPCSSTEQQTAQGRTKYQQSIEAARQANQDPNQFAQLAARLTEDPDVRENGGYMGWVDAEKLLPELKETVAKMKPGEVSEPVTTAEGYHVLLMLGRQTIRDLCQIAMFNQTQTRLIEQLRRDATIQLFDLDGTPLGNVDSKDTDTTATL